MTAGAHTETLLGQQVRVVVRPGTEPGPPLLVCNGIGASIELLQPFVDQLDPRIGTVAFDVPGIGGSEAPRYPYNFPLLARSLGKMLTRMGIDEFDVLGISWGGGLAQQIAFQFPKRCRRVVLVSTGMGSLMIPGSPKVLSKMVTPRRWRNPEYARAIAPELYGGTLRDKPEVSDGLRPGGARVTSRRGYLLQLLAGCGWSSLPGLPLLRQQTLILAGDDDPIIPVVNARIMHALIPHSTLHIFHDGHLGLVTQAAELGPMVSRFLHGGD